MSASGLRIRSLVMLAPQSELAGTLVVGGQAIELRGVVVWATPPDHAGFVPAELGQVIHFGTYFRRYNDLGCLPTFIGA